MMLLPLAEVVVVLVMVLVVVVLVMVLVVVLYSISTSGSTVAEPSIHAIVAGPSCCRTIMLLLPLLWLLPAHQ